MMLTLLESSEIEPITLTEVKAHLRLDTDSEDDLLNGLIAAATNMVEAYLGKSLIKKTWRFVINSTGDGMQGIELPRCPLIEVLSVSRLQPNGISHAIKRYTLDPYTLRPTVLCYSLQPIEVIYDAGFGLLPKHIPASIRQALIMLVVHFYENRGGVMEIPTLVKTLLAPFNDVTVRI